MSLEILTRQDLFEFKSELFKELQHILNPAQTLASKKWLKSSEVRKLLNISAGTLQNLRINGTLKFTKVGGTIYYDQDQIQTMLESGKNF